MSFGRFEHSRLRGGSDGQSIVEMAIALPLMVLLFGIVVTAGQLIGYDAGLTNASASAAAAAATAADKGTSASAAAVTAVNQEQSSTAWTACGGSIVPPCVSESSLSQNTGSGTTVTVQQVTLHGKFSPIITVLGISFPITAKAAASN